MEILRVFNNNVVLARDDDAREVILTGRGLGFQAKPGLPVDDTKVVRKFLPSDGRDPDHLAQLLAGIPPEIFQKVVDSMAAIGLGDEATDRPTLVVSLSDHVDFALERLRKHLTIEYPLRAEVESLYPSEYRQGKKLLAELNRRLSQPLPEGESVAITLHLVNASFSNGDLSETYRMTGVIQQMLKIVEESCGVKLDRGSINVGRFITHLRYLFVRIQQYQQLEGEEHSVIADAIIDSSPRAMSCAQKLASIVELRFDTSLTRDEVAYLALHVYRVSQQPKENT